MGSWYLSHSWYLIFHPWCGFETREQGCGGQAVRRWSCKPKIMGSIPIHTFQSSYDADPPQSPHSKAHYKCVLCSSLSKETQASISLATSETDSGPNSKRKNDSWLAHRCAQPVLNTEGGRHTSTKVHQSSATLLGRYYFFSACPGSVWGPALDWTCLKQ